MKKLMIALAAAATAVFAFGEDVLPHGADFEAAGYVAGENFTSYVNKADDGVATSGNRYWYSTSDDIGVISNHAAALDVPVPDLYKDATPKGGDNFLQLDTQAPLFRTIKSNDQSGSFTGVEVSTGDGVYLDTLVKFTAAESAFESLEDAADKIAIEYVEHEEESHEDGGNTVIDSYGFTNFVIRAGFIASSTALVATNYVVALPDGWLENNKKDAWHRLTVRALANIDGNNRVGFKIYLDETPMVYVTDDAPKYANFAKGAGITDDTHTIFPSAVETDKNNYNEISAVAFSGNGLIDDVVFTTNKPIFIAESEAVVVPFVADAGVTAISVLPDGATDAISVDMTAATLSATLPAQTAAFTVTATVNTADGYEFVSIKVGDTSYDVNPASVTGYAGESITITTARNNFNLFDADGNAITTGAPFQTLSAALAADGVAKIVLAHNYEVTTEEAASEQEIYTIEGNIVLDLNGKTLDGGEGNGFELFYVTGSLKVIDSVGGGKIVYGGNVFGSEGSLLVGDVSGDNGVTIDGVLFNDQAPGYIIRANVLAEDNTDTEDAFLWEGYLGDGEVIESEAKLVGDYWVVTPGGGSEPTTYAISWTLTGGTTTETAGDFEENAEIVFTADTGKTLSFVSIDGTEIADTSVYGAGSYTYTVGTAAATLVVTFTTPATPTYAISWTLTGGTTTETAGDFEENAEIVFTADTGKTLSFVSIDGTEIADTSVYGAGSYTYTVGTAAATLVVTFTGSSYPSYIDDATKQGKYDTWKAAMTAAGVDVGDGEAYEDAYLLNCKPAEVTAEKAAFKFTKIAFEGGVWVTETTTKNTSGADYNGTVTVTRYSDVGCQTPDTAGTFFKATLD